MEDALDAPCCQSSRFFFFFFFWEKGRTKGTVLVFGRSTGEDGRGRGGTEARSERVNKRKIVCGAKQPAWARRSGAGLRIQAGRSPAWVINLDRGHLSAALKRMGNENRTQTFPSPLWKESHSSSKKGNSGSWSRVGRRYCPPPTSNTLAFAVRIFLSTAFGGASSLPNS